MTSNHRPTLEGKRGKKRGIKDSIVHARSLAGLGDLKLRSDTYYDISADEPKELHKRLRQEDASVLERDETSPDIEDSAAGAVADISDTSADKAGLITGKAPVDTGDEPTVKEKTSGIHKEDTPSGSRDTSSDSDSDSDDDAELLAELQKLKQKKIEEEQQQQQQQQKNPKKSWRSSTFRKKKELNKPSDTFTTNTIESEYHQTFISKYIR